MASASPQSPRRVPDEIPGWHKLTPAEIRRLPASVPGKHTGKERLYENLQTGAVIPRRRYVDMQAQALGWKSWADYQYASRQAGGLGGMRSEAAGVINGTLQRAETHGDISADPAERRAFLRAHSAELKALARDPDNMAAHGPLAKWLEALGIREQNAPYNVGDTPRVRRR